jgi:hypothetical protein
LYRILLTADFFLFYLFWVHLMKLLRPEETERLWESAKAIARDLDIRPEDVPHPGQLHFLTTPSDRTYRI